MVNRLLFGLQTRIALALAAVLIVFVMVTELSVSRLTRLALNRPHAVAGEVATEEAPGETAVSELSANLVGLRRLVLFYLIAGGVLVLVMAALAVNRLVIRPLSSLNEALARVGEGRLGTQIPLAGARELVDIGRAFNRMTQDLSAQKGALEAQLKQIAEANRELTATQDRLVRAAKLASVGTLAAGVAHEIGNPLAGLLGLLEVLDRGEAKGSEAQYIALMKREVERIDRIIGDLLSFARSPGAGDDHPSAEVGTVLETLSPLLKAQRIFDGIELVVALHAGASKVAITPDELTQILLNLLLNAAEAVAGKGRISIATEPVERWRSPSGEEMKAIRIDVTDSGPGVPEEDTTNIFDPFFTQKGAGKGTGLGLSVCQNICDRRGGEIHLDLVYKNGARFTVTLPQVI